MTIDFAIELPWPSKELSPNASPGRHWGKKAKAIKRAKEQAYWLVWTITGGLQFKPAGKVNVMVQYYPPDKRKRDQDNMEAAMKSSFDGIAQALGIDDHLFTISREVMPDTDNKVVVFLNFEAEVIRQGQVA